jgi:dephospho-CoA kinase
MKINVGINRLSKNQRLYQLDVPVIGLTGGIATGKTTVSHKLQEEGFAVINADHLVKDIYALSETFEFIRSEFPDVIKNEQIQFPLLRQFVFANSENKVKIENFIYARLAQAFNAAFNKFDHPQMIIYDVPLLFEKSLQPLFDMTVLVYAPREIQRTRLMKRDNVLEEMADTMLNSQMDIEEKKAKADFIIDNSKSESELAEEINRLLHKLQMN